MTTRSLLAEQHSYLAAEGIRFASKGVAGRRTVRVEAGEDPPKSHHKQHVTIHLDCVLADTKKSKHYIPDGDPKPRRDKLKLSAIGDQYDGRPIRSVNCSPIVG